MKPMVGEMQWTVGVDAVDLDGVDPDRVDTDRVDPDRMDPDGLDPDGVDPDGADKVDPDPDGVDPDRVDMEPGGGGIRSSPMMCFCLFFPHGLLFVWGNASRMS